MSGHIDGVSNAIDVVGILSLGTMSTVLTGTKLTVSNSCIFLAGSEFESPVVFYEFKSSVSGKGTFHVQRLHFPTYLFFYYSYLFNVIIQRKRIPIAFQSV